MEPHTGVEGHEDAIAGIYRQLLGSVGADWQAITAIQIDDPCRRRQFRLRQAGGIEKVITHRADDDKILEGGISNPRGAPALDGCSLQGHLGQPRHRDAVEATPPVKRQACRKRAKR